MNSKEQQGILYVDFLMYSDFTCSVSEKSLKNGYQLSNVNPSTAQQQKKDQQHQKSVHFTILHIVHIHDRCCV